MDNCIFCMIAEKKIPSTCVYEDDMVMAFKDVAPKAPVHILVIPKTHIQSADYIDETNSHLVAKCFEVIAKVAKEQGVADGYKIISNCGESAGQTVKHLHFHILGGKSFADSEV